MVAVLVLVVVVVVNVIEVRGMALAVVIVPDFLDFTVSPLVCFVTFVMFAAVGSPFCWLRFIKGVWVTAAAVPGLVTGGSCLWSWSSIIKSTEPSPLTTSWTAVATIERRNLL